MHVWRTTQKEQRRADVVIRLPDFDGEPVLLTLHNRERETKFEKNANLAQLKIYSSGAEQGSRMWYSPFLRTRERRERHTLAKRLNCTESATYNRAQNIKSSTTALCQLNPKS